jgi:hypothetical protein
LIKYSKRARAFEDSFFNVALGVQLSMYFLLNNINLPRSSGAYYSLSIPIGKRLLDSKNELLAILDAFSQTDLWLPGARANLRAPARAHPSAVPACSEYMHSSQLRD